MKPAAGCWGSALAAACYYLGYQLVNQDKGATVSAVCTIRAQKRPQKKCRLFKHSRAAAKIVVSLGADSTNPDPCPLGSLHSSETVFPRVEEHFGSELWSKPTPQRGGSSQKGTVKWLQVTGSCRKVCTLLRMPIHPCVWEPNASTAQLMRFWFVITEWWWCVLMNG